MESLPFFGGHPLYWVSLRVIFVGNKSKSWVLYVVLLWRCTQLWIFSFRKTYVVSQFTPTVWIKTTNRRRYVVQLPYVGWQNISNLWSQKGTLHPLGRRDLVVLGIDSSLSNCYSNQNFLLWRGSLIRLRIPLFGYWAPVVIHCINAHEYCGSMLVIPQTQAVPRSRKLRLPPINVLISRGTATPSHM